MIDDDAVAAAAPPVARAPAPGRRGRDAAPPLFTINGRFLTQPLTGVQRYAREITFALDDMLVERGETACIAVPNRPGAIPPYRALRVLRASPATSHVWEQAVLPWHGPAPLLNMCNTAPLASRRVIVVIHDANVFTQPESYGRAFRLTYRALLPLLARGGARIVTGATDAARQLAAVLPVKLGDITVLTDGHEHALRWSAERSRLLIDTPPRRPFVLLLGSRARHKNMGLVLGLAKDLDAAGLDLYVAGGGAGVFAETTMVDHANIRWLGRVDDDDLAALFKAALCLAFPSLTEGFGLPVLEALALGCPVVSSDRASLPEVCGTAALMAAPTDPAAWMAHIVALARSPALGEALRAQGRAQAARFSWTASAAGFYAMLRQC